MCISELTPGNQVCQRTSVTTRSGRPLIQPPQLGCHRRPTLNLWTRRDCNLASELNGASRMRSWEKAQFEVFLCVVGAKPEGNGSFAWILCANTSSHKWRAVR